MVLGKLPVPGGPTNLDYSSVMASAKGGLVRTFFLLSIIFLFLPLSGRWPNIH